MKTDNYLKIILTIIAINLTLLTCLQLDLLPTVKANASGIHNYGLVPVNEDGSITVRLSGSDEIDVDITSISTSDELDINIDEVGGGFISHGGPIPVEIE